MQREQIRVLRRGRDLPAFTRPRTQHFTRLPHALGPHKSAVALIERRGCDLTLSLPLLAAGAVDVASEEVERRVHGGLLDEVIAAAQDRVAGFWAGDEDLVLDGGDDREGGGVEVGVGEVFVGPGPAEVGVVRPGAKGGGEEGEAGGEVGSEEDPERVEGVDGGDEDGEGDFPREEVVGADAVEGPEGEEEDCGCE